MSDYGFPWDSENIGTEEKPILDRAYEAEQLQGVFKRFFSNGVFMDSDNALQTAYSVVEPTNDTYVWVKSGWCHINGVFKHFDEDTPITYEPLDNPTAQTKRVDFVVLRWDAVARDITIDVKKGVQTEGDMAYPSPLTRNELVWELGIAKIFQSVGSFDVTDNRLNPHDCGIVLPFAKIDTSSLLQRLQEEMDATVEAYQDAIDGTLAGNLQNQITSNRNDINIIKSNNWVTTSRIADKNVTTGKLADKGVSTDKLADKCVTPSKLADNAKPITKVIDLGAKTFTGGGVLDIPVSPPDVSGYIVAGVLELNLNSIWLYPYRISKSHIYAKNTNSSNVTSSNMSVTLLYLPA